VADVVQETFLAAARSAGTYDPTRGTLWLWLWGIARRHVALHYRKEKRQDRLRGAADWLAASSVLRCLQEEGPAPPDVLAAAELATLVRATLTELPIEYETLLTAKYLDGATVDDIARQERSTAVAVRSKLARARQAFRELLLRHSAFANARGSV
jgi:RNA polymerase sigma-70 factor (ECF subfamily)